MKKLILAIVTACCFFASGAKAQQVSDVIDASFAVYAGCLKSIENENARTPDTVCACFTGYLGGKLNDRQYIVLGYVMEGALLQAAGAPEVQLQAVMQEMMSKGYTIEELQQVAGIMEELDSRGDAICAPFQMETMGRTS